MQFAFDLIYEDNANKYNTYVFLEIILNWNPYASIPIKCSILLSPYNKRIIPDLSIFFIKFI